MWSCRYCTLDNDELDTSCKVCQGPRFISMPTVEPMDNTYINNVSSTDQQNLMHFDIPILISPSSASHSAVVIATPLSHQNSNSKVFSSDINHISSTQSASLNTSNESSTMQEKCKRSFTNNTPKTGQTEQLVFNENHFGEPFANAPTNSKVAKKDDSWKCSSCMIFNPLYAKQCRVCAAFKSFDHSLLDLQDDDSPSDLSNSKVFMSGWNCPRCTLENDFQASICVACEFVIGQSSNAGVSGTSTTSSIQFTTQSITSPSISAINSGVKINFDQYQSSASIKVHRQNDEKNMLETVTTIRSFLVADNTSYVDHEFLPGPKALGSQLRKQLQWKRPYQIKSDENCGQWTVFQKNPHPCDIKQGLLGNCWFLSGLAVLAERPKLLKRIMITSEYNEQGVYMVRLCKAGVWQPVIIDDLLPCDEKNRLVFSQSKRRQLYVPLIEKALAKLHGSYEALQAGRSLEGLATLTGAPCYSLQFTPSKSDTEELSPDMIWARLLSAMEAGFIMGASCSGSSLSTMSEQDFYAVGLRPRHAYSVLDVRGEITYDGSLVRLVQLRNPWGQYSWNGDWSDSSIKWQQNSSLNRRLLPNRSQDGTFWITLEDMLKYFDCVDVCKILEELLEVRVKGSFPNSAAKSLSGFSLTVFEQCDVDLSIFQQVSRTTENSPRQTVDACICIYRIQKRGVGAGEGDRLGLLIESSRRQVRNQLSCNCFLDPGEYFVLCLAFNHWITGFARPQAYKLHNGEEDNRLDFVLAAHSGRPVEFIPYTLSNDTFLADAVIQLALVKGIATKVYTGVTSYSLGKGWAGLIVVMENRHPETNYLCHITCDCDNSSNIVSTRGCLEVKDVIPPLNRQVVLILSQVDHHSPFSVSYNTRSKLSHQSNRDLREWGHPGVSHVPEVNNIIAKLHTPRPL